MAEKIRIGAIISDTVHRPSITLKSSGKTVPLYARSESYNGNKEDDEYINDAEWIEKCKSRYTSPNNMRRVMIGNHYVGVKTFVTGVGENKTFIKRSMETDINYIDGAVQYTGNAFDFLRKYSLSNIEEIYFSTGVLESILRFGAYNHPVHSVSEFIQVCKGDMAKGVEMLTQIIKVELLKENATSMNVADIYSRIRAIGFIVDLDKMIESESNTASHDDSVEEMWPMIKQSKGSIILGGAQLGTKWSVLTDKNSEKHVYNDNFTYRKGLYRFDDEYLKAYSEKYNNKMMSCGSGDNVSKQSKTELERLLDGSEDASKMINALIISTSKNELIAEINKMSDNGRSKYMAYIH